MKMTKRVIVEQLRKFRGNISAVARSLGVTRQAVAYRIERDDRLKREVIAAREARLDDAESSLDRAVLEGEGWAVCFFLKTQGRGRGYVERLDVGNATEQQIDEAIAAELARLALAGPPQIPATTPRGTDQAGAAGHIGTAPAEPDSVGGDAPAAPPDDVQP